MSYEKREDGQQEGKIPTEVAQQAVYLEAQMEIEDHLEWEESGLQTSGPLASTQRKMAINARKQLERDRANLEIHHGQQDAKSNPDSQSTEKSNHKNQNTPDTTSQQRQGVLKNAVMLGAMEHSPVLAHAKDNPHAAETHTIGPAKHSADEKLKHELKHDDHHHSHHGHDHLNHLGSHQHHHESQMDKLGHDIENEVIKHIFTAVTGVPLPASPSAKVKTLGFDGDMTPTHKSDIDLQSLGGLTPSYSPAHFRPQGLGWVH